MHLPRFEPWEREKPDLHFKKTRISMLLSEFLRKDWTLPVPDTGIPVTRTIQKYFQSKTVIIFFVVARYIERNAMRANLVGRAEEWRWGSLYRWFTQPEPDPKLLSPWPLPKLPNWAHRVNEPLSEKETRGHILIEQNGGTDMRKGNSLLVSAFFAIAGLVCLFFYLRVGESVEKKITERDPLITAPIFDQWAIFPSAMVGMDEVVTPAPETPPVGSIPRIDGSVLAKYEERMFEEIIDSSRDRTVGFVRYPDEMAFNKVMCYSSYSGTGELQWMVHGADYGGTLSAGTFSEGVPEDGFFLLDLDTGKVIVQPDISNYYKGRDVSLPALGLVELINGRVVGMVSLRHEESAKLINQYLATKPEIRNCLHTEWRDGSRQ